MFTLISFVSLFSLVTLVAFISFFALITLFTFITGVTFFALFAILTVTEFAGLYAAADDIVTIDFGIFNNSAGLTIGTDVTFFAFSASFALFTVMTVFTIEEFTNLYATAEDIVTVDFLICRN